MEKDKSLLNLSAAGIGFLVTLLNLTKPIELYHLALFFCAVFFFLISIYCLLKIFEKNASYIINLTRDLDCSVIEYQLNNLDNTAVKSFYFAMILSVILGFTTTSAALFIKGN